MYSIFLVALYGPGGHDDADTEEGEELVGHLAEGAAADEDGADGIDEVVHGVDIGGELGPFWHGVRWRE